MDIFCLPLGELEANCFIVANGSDAIIFDIAGESEKVEKFLQTKNLTLKAIFLTHSHFDHIGGVKYFQDKGVAVYVSKHFNEDALTEAKVRTAYHFSKKVLQTFNLDDAIKVSDNETINIIGINVNVFLSPGHSIDGVCYAIDSHMFVGDTLFQGSYGRTDLKGGSQRQLRESILRLFALDNDYVLHCGHGNNTSMSVERVSNFILFS